MRLLVAFVLFLSCFTAFSFDIDSSVVLEKASNLDKAKEIFENIKNSKFVETVKAVKKWGFPLLESFGYIAGILSRQFFGGESKEMTYLKEQFKVINEKFDRVDQEFNNIKREIDWNVVKIQYTNYELVISVLHDMVKVISDTPENVRQVMTDKFLNSYEQTYHSAADKLYESFTNPNRIFSENLVVASRKYFRDHRTKVEKFFMGNIQLILKALQVETFYLSLKNVGQSQDYWNRDWDKRMNTLTDLMNSASEDIKNNFQKQLEEDAETFNVENYQQSNEKYVQSFYNFLNDKYNWREWFVVVYNPLSGGDIHYVSIRGGLIKFRARGHNIVVGSRDKQENYFNKNDMQNILNGLSTNIRWYKERANQLLNDILLRVVGNRFYAVAAVIEWGAGVWFIGRDDCRCYRKWDGPGKTFNVIVMG